MKQQLFNLVIGLFVAGVIYFTGKTFLPEPFVKITYYVSILVGIFVVLQFFAYILGVQTPFAL